MKFISLAVSTSLCQNKILLTFFSSFLPQDGSLDLNQQMICLFYYPSAGQMWKICNDGSFQQVVLLCSTEEF